MTYLERLNNALHELLSSRDDVLIIGEDIKDPYGGAFKVTKGLSESYPSKVFGTPISEASIVGIATGLALQGFRPIVEIMFGDFTTLIVDQILNSASKFGLMYGSNVKVPLVVRTPMGGGRGYGPTHSQSIEKLFFGMPGVKVVSPSLAHDPKEILFKSILDDSVTIFIEAKDLYTAELLNKGNGNLNIKQKNINNNEIAIVDNFSDDKPDIVIISYGQLSKDIIILMQEFIEEEINIRAIFPSEITNITFISDLVDIMKPQVGILICEPGAGNFGWNAEVLKCLYYNCEIIRNRKISCLSAKDYIIPASKEHEGDIIVNIKKIKDEILNVML